MGLEGAGGEVGLEGAGLEGTGGEGSTGGEAAVPEPLTVAAKRRGRRGA